jgi:hypothetical protein
MHDLWDLAAMTSTEALVVAATMALCVGGLLLQPFGNWLGRAFLGEDPAVKRWQQAWALRRDARRGERGQRRARKRASRAARKEAPNA